MKRDDFEAWTRDFYSDLACASDTWSDEKGAYTDCAHHMAWHLWQYSQSRLESLEQEMQEQARIIGMGAERELALVAKVESLEKDAARYKGMRNLLYSQNIVIGEARLILKVTGCCPDENEFDSGIDTAMQANNGE